MFRIGLKIVLMLLMALPLSQALLKTGALRMCDSDSCELTVKLVSSVYQFAVYNSFFLSNSYLVLCVRQRVTSQLENNDCELGGLTNGYSCLGITPATSGGAVTSLTVQTWTTDSTASSGLSSKTAYGGSNSVGTTQSSISLNTFLGITSITDVSTAANKPKIYEVYVGYVDALQADSRTKNAFFHTFRISTQTDSDDLFMQRNPQCMLFFYSTYYNYNLVFYGGTIRGGNQTMFFHVLSYLEDTTGAFPTIVNLNAWIGISLSRSHAGRDMMAFITANSTIMDMYSLYYHSPYLDKSPNVEGQDDLQLVSDSTTNTKGNTTYYFSGGLVRLYNTGDFRGDEIIRKKINNTYCLAIAYSNNTNANPHSPIVSTNTHDYYSCFSSTVALSSPFLVLPLILVLLLAFTA